MNIFIVALIVSFVNLAYCQNTAMPDTPGAPQPGMPSVIDSPDVTMPPIPVSDGNGQATAMPPVAYPGGDQTPPSVQPPSTGPPSITTKGPRGGGGRRGGRGGGRRGKMDMKTFCSQTDSAAPASDKMSKWTDFKKCIDSIDAAYSAKMTQCYSDQFGTPPPSSISDWKAVACDDSNKDKLKMVKDCRKKERDAMKTAYKAKSDQEKQDMKEKMKACSSAMRAKAASP